jgi:formylglycine-generating enzyme required for sulfatase activity
VDTTPAFTDAWGATYRLVEPGTFRFGNAASDASPVEQPAAEVTVEEPFFMGERLVTQAHWMDVMGDNPSKFQEGWSAGLRPVECVNFHDIEDFLRRLNEREKGESRLGLEGAWRLPSEVEWEYTARAGSTTRWAFGDKDVELDDYGWHAGNAGGHTREVGLKKPNPWGFFDMNGLVNEWCSDDWVPHLNDVRGQQPHVVPSSLRKVVRGGSWFTESESTRNGARSSSPLEKRSDGLGFRLVWAPF